MKKQLCWLVVSLFLMVVLAGCGPSLKEYVGMSNNYNTKVTAKNGVVVDIGSTDTAASHAGGVFGLVGSAVNIAADVSAMAISSEQEARLHRIVDPAVIGALVSDGFSDAFADETHLVEIKDNSRPDLRIRLTVRRYGLWADSVLSPMNFFMEARISIIYEPEMKEIYSNGVSLMREVSSVFSDIANALDASVTGTAYATVPNTHRTYKSLAAIDDTGRLVSGAANLTAFFQLSDEEISAVFQYMAYDTGLLIAHDLTRAIYR
ncbi:MAG: hypothetical protein II767_04840 [Proteobacteria bacterium]|nr:hypothetical protein [Pseudomonadota bacterium]MBQ4359563.1 hypothetical protein [Pseudomonadota bacterium]